MNELGKNYLSGVPSGRRSPFLTYELYYGLREKPFSLAADRGFSTKARRTPAPSRICWMASDGARG